MTFQERFLKWLPKFYRKDILSLDITKTAGKQLDNIEKKINEIEKQQYLNSATWGLDIFEKELNIKGKSKPVEQRQAVIKAKWRGAGKLTLLLIQRTLQSYLTGNIIVKFQKRLLITMQGEILEAIHFQDVVHTVEEVKPAHLGWNLQYILPEVQNKVVVGAFTQSAIYVHVLPKTESKWETQTTVCTGARVHAGIYVEIKER